MEASAIVLKIGNGDVNRQWDGVTSGLVSGIVKLANLGIKVEINNTEVVVDDDQVPWGQEKKILIKVLNSRTDKKDLATILNNLNSCLSSSNKYNLAKIKEALKGKTLTIDQIALLKGKSGNDLVVALLNLLNLDPAQFETENVQALDSLSDSKLAQVTDPQTIEDNVAYKAFTISNYDLDKLTPENKKRIEAAKKKLAELKNTEEAKKKEEEEKQKKIDDLYTAIKHGTADKDQVVSNKDALNSKLNSNQRILSFTDGKTYVVLVEEKGINGKKEWQIVTNFQGEENYYLEIKAGKLIVKKKVSFWGDPELATEVLVSPGGAEDQPVDLKETEKKAWNIISHLTGGKLTLELFRQIWEDKVINQKEAQQLGIGSQYFHLIDNNMVAGESGGNKELTLEELQEAETVIGAYAKALGIKEEKAAELYRTARSFRNVEVKQLTDAGNTLAGKLGGVVTLEESAARTELGKLGYHADIVNLLLAGWSQAKEEDKEAKARELAQKLLQAAMASLTGNYEAFGLKKESFSGMQTYAPKKVTKDNLLAWLETGEVEEEEEREGHGGSGSAEARNRALSELQYSNNVDDAEKIYEKHKKHLKNNDKANNYMASLWINKANSDLVALDKADEYIQKMSEGEDKQQLFARLILKALEVDSTKAKSYLEKFKELRIADGARFSIREGSSVDKDQFIQYVENVIFRHADIRKIEERVLHQDERTGEYGLISGLKTTVSAISTLENIITSPTSPKYTPKDKAYARLIKARILRLQAKLESDPKKAETLFTDAMKEMRLAWDAYLALLNGTPTETRYLDGLKAAFAEMAELVSGLLSTGGNRASEKLAKTLAGYIPIYDNVNVTVNGYKHFPSASKYQRNQRDEITPAQFRKDAGAGSKDLGKDLSSNAPNGNPDPTKKVKGKAKKQPPPTNENPSNGEGTSSGGNTGNGNPNNGNVSSPFGHI